MPISMTAALAIAGSAAALPVVDRVLARARAGIPITYDDSPRWATPASMVAAGVADSGPWYLDEARRIDAIRAQIPGAGRPIDLRVERVQAGSHRQWAEDPAHRDRLIAAGWTPQAIAATETRSDVEQLELFYGPPRGAFLPARTETGEVVGWAPVTTWAQVETIWRQVEAFRRRADAASSSSSWQSLGALGGFENSPSWKMGSRSGFWYWMWHQKGREGGLRHIAAVERRLAQTGGNESTAGAIARLVGGALDSLGVLGAVLGGALAIVVPGVGTAVAAAGAAAAAAGRAVGTATGGDVWDLLGRLSAAAGTGTLGGDPVGALLGGSR